MPSGRSTSPRAKARCSICNSNAHDRRKCPNSPATIGAFGAVTAELCERLMLLALALSGPALEFRAKSKALDTLIGAGSVVVVDTIRGLRLFALSDEGRRLAHVVATGVVAAGESITRAISAGLTASRSPAAENDPTSAWAKKLLRG